MKYKQKCSINSAVNELVKIKVVVQRPLCHCVGWQYIYIYMRYLKYTVETYTATPFVDILQYNYWSFMLGAEKISQIFLHGPKLTFWVEKNNFTLEAENQIFLHRSKLTVLRRKTEVCLTLEAENIPRNFLHTVDQNLVLSRKMEVWFTLEAEDIPQIFLQRSKLTVLSRKMEVSRLRRRISPKNKSIYVYATKGMNYGLPAGEGGPARRNRSQPFTTTCPPRIAFTIL